MDRTGRKGQFRQWTGARLGPGLERIVFPGEQWMDGSKKSGKPLGAPALAHRAGPAGQLHRVGAPTGREQGRHEPAHRRAGTRGGRAPGAAHHAQRAPDRGGPAPRRRAARSLRAHRPGLLQRARPRGRADGPGAGHGARGLRAPATGAAHRGIRARAPARPTRTRALGPPELAGHRGVRPRHPPHRFAARHPRGVAAVPHALRAGGQPRLPAPARHAGRAGGPCPARLPALPARPGHAGLALRDPRDPPPRASRCR